MAILRGNLSLRKLCVSVALLGLVTLIMPRPPVLAAQILGTMPVPGPVQTEFHPPEQDWLAGHRGLDLGATIGEKVVAPRAGVVGFVGEIAGTPIITIWHGTVRTTYQPVVTSLSPGATIATGTVIGRIAPKGGHCAGRCLHWGLRSGEHYLDPRLLLGGGRVRLISVQD